MIFEEIASGRCGENAVYSIVRTESGAKLTISGKGQMTDYESPEASPFFEYRKDVTELYIGDGITGIGDYSFRDETALTSVRLPGTARYIGTYSFGNCSALKTVRIPEGVRSIGPKCFEKCTALEKLILPSTLAAIDFKCFGGIENTIWIVYNGSEAQWSREVRVSSSACGNKAIETAVKSFTAESSHFRKMLSKMAGIIANGGDGQMHIIAPNLTMPGIAKKSGDCTFIIFPDGKTMMIDAGVDDASGHVVSMLSALKLKRLDYFVLSHPHRDHFGGVLDSLGHLTKKMGGSIGCFICSGYETGKPAEQKVYDFLGKKCEEKRIVRMGDRMKIGGVELFIFNPDEAVLRGEGAGDAVVNNTSVCIKFTYGESTFIAAGDLYADRERILAEKFGSLISADAIKVNHHAAYTSSTVEWFNAVDPRILISEEDGSIWSRFDERIKKAGIRNYKTSETGMSILSFDKNKNYRVKTEFDNKK